MNLVEHELTSSKEVLKRLLPLMSRHAGDFRPPSYALWFEYATGNDRLRAVLEPMVRAGQRIDSERTYALYHEHLIAENELAVARARQGLLDVVSETSKAAATADQQTTVYRRALDAFGAEVAIRARADDPIRELSATMLAETQRIGESIEHLITQYRLRQDEILRLGDELGRLREQVQRDDLSGLINRRGFDEAVRNLCDRDADERSPVTLLMIDIDHFKQVNDRFGHLLGDEVVRGVAATIRAHSRGNDISARFGGDEFAVLLPDTPLSGAMTMAERIHEAVSRNRITDANGNDGPESITVSIGVAERRPNEPADSLIGRADRALYRSKVGGRDRITTSQ